ncbi:MAG: flagellar export protein FliJ [Liquorilactobacillus nagelii]|uniref:flagellar export protein FliJ n=1 Tax=Liquorilactobacillus nagelii TaxID=82688 RepID=UPI0011D083AF|nr:flagellar export protein FliJ [Liquorilactobacillus nagelii]MCC7616657.1 flagellar export protein FliJ [Liquorilactobacillus nagelii]
MKKFNFSLTNLLDFRQQQTDQAKENLMLEQKKLSLLQQKLSELLQEKKATFKIDDFNIGRMQLQYRYILSLEHEIQLATAAVAQQQQQVEQAREKLIAAKKESQVLEKLEEKQYNQYLLNNKHQEQVMLDEIANRKKFSLF